MSRNERNPEPDPNPVKPKKSSDRAPDPDHLRVMEKIEEENHALLEALARR